MENIQINILTRTGSREILFNNLKNSILNQNYSNIKHIISCDNENCSYLKNEDNVIKTIKKDIPYFYNSYLNELAKNVTHGWIIILDDDSKIINNNFVSDLAKICENSNPKDVLIYRIKYGLNGNILPSTSEFEEALKEKKIINKKPIRSASSKNGNKYKKNFKLCTIDMACFCVHYSLFQKYKFEEISCADYNFLKNLKNVNFKYLLDFPISLWANYEDPKKGNSEEDGKRFDKEGNLDDFK
tara:strand:+ start:277 stop:1005 length:729 start_codon:yes stop_codon:yes gene_type:complete